MIFLGLKLVLAFAVIVAINIFLDPQITRRALALNQRMKLLFLAVFDLRNAVLAVVLAGVAYAMSMAGWLAGYSELFDAQGTAPAFVLWLIDPSALNLCFLSLLGFFMGFLSRSFGFSVVLSMSLLFPSLISAPGASLLIFSEMAGQSLRYFLRSQDSVIARAVILRFSIFVVSALAFWAGGGVLRGLLQSLDLHPMQLMDRLLEVGILCAITLIFDTVVSMFTFHFYYQRTKDQ